MLENDSQLDNLRKVEDVDQLKKCHLKDLKEKPEQEDLKTHKFPKKNQDEDQY